MSLVEITNAIQKCYACGSRALRKNRKDELVCTKCHRQQPDGER